MCYYIYRYPSNSSKVFPFFFIIILANWGTVFLSKVIVLDRIGRSRLILWPSSLVSGLQIHQNLQNHITYGYNYISNHRSCDKNIFLGDLRTIFVPKMLKFGKNGISRLVFRSSSVVSTKFIRIDKIIILGDWRTIFVPKMLKFDENGISRMVVRSSSLD